MGGHPKALLPWHGETFLEGILKACRAAGIQRRVVVLGHHADLIQDAVPLDEVMVVRSEALDAGPIGSIRSGLKAVSPHPVSGVLLWPVDRPHVQIATVEALQSAFRDGEAPIVVPRFDGHRGHPVIFGRSVFHELEVAPDNEGARAVVHRDPARVMAVDVPDPAVIEDVNTPDEYQDLVRRTEAAE